MVLFWWWTLTNYWLSSVGWADIQALALWAPVALERGPQGLFLRGSPTRKPVLCPFCHYVQFSFAYSKSTLHPLCARVLVHWTDLQIVCQWGQAQRTTVSVIHFFLIENVRHWIESIPISVSQCPSENKPLTISCSNDENGLKLKNPTFIIYEKRCLWHMAFVIMFDHLFPQHVLIWWEWETRNKSKFKKQSQD